MTEGQPGPHVRAAFLREGRAQLGEQQRLGTKNTTAKIIIQVKAWPPPWATAAMVSTPTIVQMRKKRMSKRPK
jgi:hypothetical protein